jgi:hypothetical protein
LKRLDEYPIDKCINSTFYLDTLKIINNFLSSIKETANIFLRISYNFTFSLEHQDLFIHKDHVIPHKQIIIYLNDPFDKEASTFILNEKKK